MTDAGGGAVERVRSKKSGACALGAQIANCSPIKRVTSKAARNGGDERNQAQRDAQKADRRAAATSRAAQILRGGGGNGSFSSSATKPDVADTEDIAAWLDDEELSLDQQILLDMT